MNRAEPDGDSLFSSAEMNSACGMDAGTPLHPVGGWI